MTDLTGRERECALLEDELAGAALGRGGLVVVTGEPGIGKTRLLDEAADRARAHGFTVVGGTAWDGSGAPELWPWQRVAEGLGSRTPFDRVSDDPGSFALFVSVSDLVRSAAISAPVLVVLDDLQWADDACLRLLRFVAKDVRRDRVLLLTGARSDSPHARGLTSDTSAVRRHIALSGLSPRAVAELLRAITGHEQDGQHAEEVAARTGGNPFFVHEIAGQPSGSTTLPSAVAHALETRLSALSGRTLDALTVAAAIGRTFELDVVAVATGSSRRAVARCMDEAVQAGVLAPGTEIGLFAHDLMREHLLAALDEKEAREVHARIVEALTRLPDTTMRDGRLAGHAVRAVPGVPPAEAVRLCRRAAASAAGNLAFGEAARHLDAARSLAPDDLELHLELSDALLRAGRRQQASEGYHAVTEAATEPGLLARAALGLHEAGHPHEGSKRNLLDRLGAAREGLASTAGDAALLARVTAAMARELADGPEGDRARAALLSEQALELARTTNRPEVLGPCLFARHDVIWEPGTARARAELGAELQALGSSAPALAFQGALCRYVALLELGDSATVTALETMEDLAGQSGQPLLDYLARTRRDGWDAIHDVPRIEERIAASRELGDRLEVPDAQGVFVTQLVTLDVISGDGRRVHRRQLSLGRLMPVDFAVEERAFELLATGDEAGVARLLAAAAPPDQRALFRWRALAALAFQVEVAWRAGAAQVCADAYERLAPHSGQVVVIGGGVSVVGPVDLYLALAAAGTGDGASAVRHLDSARSTAEVLGADAWLTRIGELGRALGGAAAGFKLDGTVWRLDYAGRTAHLPDSKGLRDIAALLRGPGREVAATTLAGGGPIEPLGSDPVLDATALAAYRSRLAALDLAIADARADGNAYEQGRSEDERDALIEELRRASGLGGRTRRLGDPGERARSTVTARIRDALRRVAQVHPELAEHLQQSLHTGRACVYRPERPTRWDL